MRNGYSRIADGNASNVPTTLTTYSRPGRNILVWIDMSDSLLVATQAGYCGA